MECIKGYNSNFHYNMKLPVEKIRTWIRLVSWCSQKKLRPDVDCSDHPRAGQPRPQLRFPVYFFFTVFELVSGQKTAAHFKVEVRIALREKAGEQAVGLRVSRRLPSLVLSAQRYAFFSIFLFTRAQRRNARRTRPCLGVSEKHINSSFLLRWKLK